MKRSFFTAEILFLVLLLVLPAFSGCSENGADGENTTAEASVTTQTPEVEVVETSILEGVRFDGKKLGVYCWVDTNVPEYLDADQRSGSIEDAIFSRLMNSEELLGITTEWKLEKGNGSNKKFIDNVVTASQSSHDFDVVCCYSVWASAFASRGVLLNLNDYGRYLNFNHPCWPKMMIDGCTINDKLYFCTGDISNNLIYMTSLVYFNKDLAANYHLDTTIKEKYGAESLYQLVRSGKWTNEALFTLAGNVYSDLDNDGKKTENDLYGFGTYNTLVDNFFYGAGLKTIVAGENGLVVSPDLSNVDTITDILANVNAFLHDSGYAYFFSDHSGTRNSFSNQKTLFSLAPASHAYGTHSKASGLSYGVLPVPKYKAEQENYYSVHSMPYSMFGILNGTDDPEASAAFLEAMGEFSFELTRPVFFEETMKARYSETLDDAIMWDMIIDSQTFDLGRIFSDAFKQETVNLFRSQVVDNTASASGIKPKYNMIEKMVTEINKSFGELQ